MASLAPSVGGLARASPARRGARRASSFRVSAAAGGTPPDASDSSSSSASKPAAPSGAVWENKNVRMWDVDIEAEFERQARRKAEEEAKQKQEAASGLGFGNLAMLDDMSVDLSARLVKKEAEAEEEDDDAREDEVALLGDGGASGAPGPQKSPTKKPGTRPSVALSAITAATSEKKVSKYDLDGWNYAPTRAEQARWQREWEKGEAIAASKNPVYAKSKFSTRQLKKLRPKDLKPTVGGRELTEAEKAERRRSADDAYLRVKQNLLLTTAGLCGSGTVAAFFVGGVDLGASFAFGSAGALFYVKLLASKAESGGGGQGGPPSILVPVILFMALNRWNTFFAEDVGLSLAPIPMLLGFFTYKPASVFQAFRDILEEEQAEEEGLMG